MKHWSPHVIPKVPRGYREARWRTNPPQLLFFSYLVLIIVGTGLLKTPWATVAPISWLEAAFTAVSAVTVTGLVVVDTGSQYELFGQLVILVLIQLGGLGLMTFAVLTALALGVRLGLRQQIVVREALNQTSLSTIKQTVRAIFLFALIFEAIGLAVLAWFWVPELGWSQGLYHALFYTISAFNNSGFALSPESLSSYVGHSGIVLTVSALFIVGGLGYPVVMELVEKKSFHTLSLYSKLILLTTLGLNIVAASAFFTLEYGNPETLGALDSLKDKILAAWFQGTTPRTAGFNTVNIGSLTAATSVFLLLLMFVGGASNSTASGIKLSTFIVLLAATRSFFRGNLAVTLGKHSLPQDTVVKALAIATIGLMVIFLAVLALSALEQAPFLDIAFEVVSAFGTVGLSRGLTDQLSAPSQCMLMVVMIIGRVGPLTLGFLLARPRPEYVRYSKVEMPLG